jgi:hypothetical protein
MKTEDDESYFGMLFRVKTKRHNVAFPVCLSLRPTETGGELACGAMRSCVLPRTLASTPNAFSFPYSSTCESSSFTYYNMPEVMDLCI